MCENTAARRLFSTIMPAKIPKLERTIKNHHQDDHDDHDNPRPIGPRRPLALYDHCDGDHKKPPGDKQETTKLPLRKHWQDSRALRQGFPQVLAVFKTTPNILSPEYWRMHDHGPNSFPRRCGSAARTQIFSANCWRDSIPQTMFGVKKMVRVAAPARTTFHRMPLPL